MPRYYGLGSLMPAPSAPVCSNSANRQEQIKFAAYVEEARADVLSSMRIRPVRNRPRTFNEVRFDDFARFRRARALLDERLKRDRNDADGWLVAAAVAFRQFDDGARVGGNRVEQDFTRAVQARPGDVNALMARGLVLRHATRLVRPQRGGIRLQRRTATRSEIGRSVHAARAIVRGTTPDDLAKAVADAKRALQLVPGDRRLIALVDKLRAGRVLTGRADAGTSRVDWWRRLASLEERVAMRCV